MWARLLSLAALLPLLANAEHSRLRRALSATRHSGDDVYMVTNMLDKFSTFAIRNKALSQERHEEERQRLQAAIAATEDTGAKMALEESETNNEESRMEASNVFNELTNFANTVKNALGAQGSMKGKTCHDLTCGPHASCSQTNKGAQCICNEGFEGNGFVCKAPDAFAPQHLIPGTGRTGKVPQVADIHVTGFRGNMLLCAYRDVGKGNKGFLLVGVTQGSKITWSPPDLFSSGSAAFAPKVAGLPNNRIAVVYRDAQRDGAARMHAGELGASGVSGAIQHVTWGAAVQFGKGQSHRMAIVALPNSRVCVFYSDHIPGNSGQAAQSFGNSLLAQVDTGGHITTLGRFRFSESPVARITATLAGPSSFVIGYRGGKIVTDADLTIRQEASAVYGEMTGQDLLYDPNPVHLEPERTQMWDRSVSLVARDRVSYTYQSGTDQKTMVAIIAVDPTTRRLQLVDGPKVLHNAFTPYVGSVSMPYAPSDPHTLSFYQPEDQKGSLANICSMSVAGKLSRCQEFGWVPTKVSAVSAVSMEGGRTLFVYADEAGQPYYQLVGVFKK